MANFLSPLQLEYVDGRTWKLTAAFSYHFGAPDGTDFVEIPVGFLTDFASIPRVLWPVWPPTGTYGKAAVIHDWLYQYQTFCHIDEGQKVKVYGLIDRGKADAILLEAMEVLGVSWFTRRVIYAGVRAGGWVPWNAYRREQDL